MNRNDTAEGKIGTVDDSEDDNDGNDDGSSDKDYCSFAFFFLPDSLSPVFKS